MKNKRLSLLVALVAAPIFFIGGFFWWNWAVSPASRSSPAVAKVFVIKRGESLPSVAGRLQKEGLIRSALAFKILVLTGGLVGKIQAGSFYLRSSVTANEIGQTLTRGSRDIWLTFPEGWRREEFARRLAANLEGFDEEEFLRLTENLEGELFPDTYLVPKNASPSAVVNILTGNFEKKTKDLKIDPPQLIIASIIEREARYEKDRPLVAEIILKRWQQNWLLQTDATLQYIVANLRCQRGERECDWWPKVSPGDKKIDSPYNTYKYKGLPPTPIANPGLPSLKAIIYPHSTDYWFYLSDSAGRIHYAKTMEEHNQNIEKYLK